MTRYLLIVNPTSGRGFAGRSLSVIEQEMKKYNLDYKLVLTERPWQAADLAEQGARDGASHEGRWLRGQIQLRGGGP